MFDSLHCFIARRILARPKMSSLFCHLSGHFYSQQKRQVLSVTEKTWMSTVTPSLIRYGESLDVSSWTTNSKLCLSLILIKSRFLECNWKTEHVWWSWSPSTFCAHSLVSFHLFRNWLLQFPIQILSLMTQTPKMRKSKDAGPWRNKTKPDCVKFHIQEAGQEFSSLITATLQISIIVDARNFRIFLWMLFP